jgi:acyl-CoA synthetase (AMP-forming)/AMP-acid ligase II
VGETVVAAVVPDATAPVDAETLSNACRNTLAHYKCPTAIHFVSELPRNATGKVLRCAVRQSLSTQATHDHCFPARRYAPR